MPPFLLGTSAPASATQQLVLTGIDFVPATVALLVLIALGTSLVVASRRRRESDD